MVVAGTYQFVYTLNGCTDTVSVVVQPCQGCVKPNAGPDAAICAPATTAKLTAVTAGGTWSPIGSPANPAAASIDASGNVSGMTANGTYRFVYSVTSGGQTCTDTASVVRNAKPSAGPDQTLACANPATNTLTTSTTLVPRRRAAASPSWATSPHRPSINGNSRERHERGGHLPVRLHPERLHGHGIGGGAALPGLREAQRGPRRGDLRAFDGLQADGGDGGRHVVAHR